MRYRKQAEPDGDYSFGFGPANFFIDVPEAVAQAVKTRLLLIEGEWFLDVTSGTPYESQILGAHKSATYDQAIRTRIVETEGVLDLLAYSSSVVNRNLKVNATIATVYGQIELEQIL